VPAFSRRRSSSDHLCFERREIRVAKVEQFGQ
jgi:hypothetical protein